jgi:8-oxo-dGTP pyrophosphatase MutT (NUDIX family)
VESKTDLDFIHNVKRVLSERQKISIIEKNRRPSAVLIPVYYAHGQQHIVFTKRTELVHYHKGEISFPGGGFHEEDVTLVNTALRETWEEIGIAPEDVEVLGELDDSLTKGSQYIITPFVGVIPSEYDYKLNAFETAEVIQIPVLALMEKDCRKEDPLLWLEGRSYTRYRYAYQNNTIIGATARILKQYLDIFAQVMKS